MNAGAPFPLGASPGHGGVNVAALSRHGERIHFCVFDGAGERELHRFVLPQRMGDVHFGFIAGIGPGTRYGLRAEGPWDEGAGHRFDATKLLVDPYATRIDRAFRHDGALCRRGAETAALVPKSIVEAPLDGAAALPPRRPLFIYEIQIRSFSLLHPAIPKAMRGTAAALSHPALLAHLKRLSVDTVELMPLAAWIDERHLPPLGLSNIWGYNPVTFMAADPRLAPGGLAEVARAVRAFHDAGIRVILDVVLNHTGESDAQGATLSLRGLDNALYYAHVDGRLANDTGCGNTLALFRAPVARLAADSLRHWAMSTGVDGFRLDLAVALGRGADRRFDVDSPLLSLIEQDPLLSRLTLIAEPWDLGPDGYRLGRFPARWLEWNDKYRDDARRFWRGDAASAGALATRLAGSSDLFGAARRPSSSVNFVAAHDGFTLRDCVTFAAKNNFANGEDNRDGNAHEITWQGGDARALLATLFLSRGTPMLTAGDEFGRTQKGNNNAYALDNALTWLDWSTRDEALIEFVATLARLRVRYPQLSDDRFLTGAPDREGMADAQWLAADGTAMDWGDHSARAVGLVLSKDGARIAIWLNAGPAAIVPRNPPRDGYQWSREFCSAPGEGVPARAAALYVEDRTKTAGVTDALLGRLAAEAGISREWWEVDGTHHLVPVDTLRHILRALGVAYESVSSAEHSMRALRQRPRPIIGMAGEEFQLAKASEHRARWILTAENGEATAFDVGPGSPFRATLAAGFYLLRSEGDWHRQFHVLVSPTSCHLPDWYRHGGRVWGMAAHLYALRHRGDGGIGNLDTLRRYSDVVAEVGGKFAGINPLHHLFPHDRSRVSPYQPSDRRFVDPIYIDLALLLADFGSERSRSLVASRQMALARLEQLEHIDYRELWAEKAGILEQVHDDFSASPDFDRFVASGGEALSAHCAHEARLAGDRPNSKRLRYRAFLQWIADRQLARAARSQNLYMDLALGCAMDGGEVMASPRAFAKGVSIGAPPDPFSAQGQVWNLPPFSPLVLEETGLGGFREILAANMRHASALRIDHVMGLTRQFWVPLGAEGRAGAYVAFPFAAMLAATAIESMRSGCLVVGEDLGNVPEGFRQTMERWGMLSCRVLWLERQGHGFLSPSHYPRSSLACISSHDLPTLIGWRRGRDIEIEKQIHRIDENAAARRTADRDVERHALDAWADNRADDEEGAAVAVHRQLAATASAIMMAQVDDLADEAEPLNVPGTDSEWKNWRRRVATPIEDVGKTGSAAAILAAIKEERPS